jgi:resolvase-like protein
MAFHLLFASSAFFGTRMTCFMVRLA